jgi:hypothetical protein
LLALSFSAVAGTTIKKTMRLRGLCGKQELLILIDSGSSWSFISEQYVAKVGLQTEAIPEMQVSMAIGQQMSTAYQVPQFTWLTQGHTFSSDVKVFPLHCYDLILGMDWLESHSPMLIHWKGKS